MKRVFLIVLDSFGIGELPDAEKFSDKGANTLKSISKSEFFSIPNLISLGLGNISGVDCIEKTDTPSASFGKCKELSMGKDTTVGHWEIAGVISEKPLPTYPNGFDKEIIDEFSRLTKRKVICNKPYSGTQVIKDYGKEHTESGALIVYTSADSVFQIAAHENIVPVETLYEYCRIARGILKGKHGVGRVIARPFTGEYPNFQRTANRHDFSLEPSNVTMLDAITKCDLDVISVGKIYDIFAGRGIKISHFTHSNAEGIKKTLEIMDSDFCGLCFTNLVDFDMLYGHRNDIDGYARAISYFDTFLPEIIKKLKDEDLLIITADHGCDPGDISTDHTREYIPLLVYKNGKAGTNLGIRDTYADISSTICEYLGVDFASPGKSFLKEIIKNDQR
ncbi:MAG: phosphopentomutase [Clostridia bacterium]|nr:phosphopentomutase [Clostridia bacterium]